MMKHPKQISKRLGEFAVAYSWHLLLGTLLHLVTPDLTIYMYLHLNIVVCSMSGLPEHRQWHMWRLVSNNRTLSAFCLTALHTQQDNLCKSVAVVSEPHIMLRLSLL